MRHRRRQHCCCCAAGKPSLLDTHTDAVCILLGVWLAAMALMPLARSEFVPRNFSGIGNNVANPTWGVAETTQVRVCERYTDMLEESASNARPGIWANPSSVLAPHADGRSYHHTRLSTPCLMQDIQPDLAIALPFSSSPPLLLA